MASAKAKGYGKVILFGEHFVVYGLPGIAAGIDKFVEVEIQQVKDSTDVIFDDKIFKEKVSLKEQPDNIKSKILKAIMEEEEFVKLEGLKININANMPAGAGLGYSAALSVAMAGALNQILDLGWKQDKINEAAFRAEKINHGNPSGIDNSCATYGTVIWFEKNMKGGENTIRPFKCGKSLLCLLVDTGIKHDTKQAVQMVKEDKEKNPKKYEKLFSEYKSIVTKAKKEVQFGGVEEIGKLMNQNHLLLKELNISTKEIDEIIKIASYENARGAKITGAGMGGNVLILCYNEAQQDKLIAMYSAKNYNSIKVKIN